MSLEDEKTGAEEDQERRVKKRRIACQMKHQILCLPNDALYCVLDKLLELVDYVRLAANCKELQQVAKVYNSTKQRWVSKPKLLPMLMLPPNESDNDTKQRLLYSVTERRIYNINICLTNDKLCGSSQGWLASALKSTEEWQEKRKLKLIHEITLRNPFGKASEVIHLPPYMHYFHKFQHRLTEWIPRVILSANPTLHPENYYVLFALYRPLETWIGYNTSDHSPPLALIKGGQESWITIKQLLPDLPKFDDAIFHKNKVYLLLEGGHRIVTVDVNSIINLSKTKIQYMGFEPTPRDIFPEHYCWEQYLVESTNGDLLLVLRFYSCDKETSFGICKIVFNEEDTYTVQLVEVKCIGDDAIFLGQSQSQSVLASSVPGCKPNCIYYATESVRRNHYPNKSYYLESEMGIFSLGDRTRTTLIDSDSISNWNWNKMNMPFWVLPSLNI